MVEPPVKLPNGNSAAVLSAIIGSIVGGLACLLGVIALFNPDLGLVVALGFLVPGLLVIPPVTQLVRKHLPFTRATFVPPTVAFGLWVFIMVGVSPFMASNSTKSSAEPRSESGQSTPQSREQVLAEVEQLITAGTTASTTEAMVKLNASFPARELNTDPQLKPIMDRARAAYERSSVGERASAYAARLNGFWTDKLREMPTTAPTSPEEIWAREKVFADIARELDEGDELKSDPLTARSMASLRQMLVAKQSSGFPVLRRGYGQVVGRAVWEQDVEVVVQGNGGRTIRFIAGMFAANRNVASAQQNARSHLEKLRFGRSQYEWYRGSEHPYYTLETPPDGAVGYWESGRFVTVD